MESLLKQGDVHVKSDCIGMNTIYRDKLNAEGDRTRIEKLEMFDEFEEWELLQGHYCICLAQRA